MMKRGAQGIFTAFLQGFLHIRQGKAAENPHFFCLTAIKQFWHPMF
jgi:hypothetical protein